MIELDRTQVFLDGELHVLKTHSGEVSLSVVKILGLDMPVEAQFIEGLGAGVFEFADS